MGDRDTKRKLRTAIKARDEAVADARRAFEDASRQANADLAGVINEARDSGLRGQPLADALNMTRGGVSWFLRTYGRDTPKRAGR